MSTAATDSQQYDDDSSKQTILDNLLPNNSPISDFVEQRTIINKALLMAIKNGSSVAEIRSLLEQGADPNFQEDDADEDHPSETLLVIAIRAAYSFNNDIILDPTPLGGISPVVELLLSFGANVTGGTVVENGHYDVLHTNLSSPLTVAASLDATTLVYHLITVHGAAVSVDVLTTASVRALVGHHKDTVKLLLDLGALLPAPENKDHLFPYYGIAMAIACLIGDLDMLCTELKNAENLGLCCHRLVNHPVYIPQTDAKETLLQYAISTHQHEIIEYLLCELDADPNYSCDGCHYPLLTAISMEDSICVDLLCKYGADLNIYDHNGWTPMMHATYSENDEIIECLQYYQVINDEEDDVSTINHLIHKLLFFW